MNYAVMTSVNGTFKIETEWTGNLDGAKNNFWDKCKAYNNASDVEKATIAIIDENLDVVDGKKEFITHPVEPNEE